jgi:excisionase family DNA binding protein
MNQSLPILEDPILTVPEVARYLKISKAKIYYLVSKKEIPHLKIGRNIRIRQRDFQIWLEKQVMQLSFDALPRPMKLSH